MSATLVINASKISDYSAMLLGGGDDCLTRINNYVQALGDVDAVVVLAAQKELQHTKGWVYDDAPLTTTTELIAAMQRNVGDSQTIIYIWMDQPFLSAELTKHLLSIHRDYICEYTFADGYPIGFTPEILHASLLTALQNLLEKKDEKLDRASIFRVLERDINAFDIETEMADYDYRLLRAELCTDNRRNFLCCNKIADKVKENTDAAILAVLREDRSVLRTLPAYIRIQLSNYSKAWPNYEPALSGEPATMPLANYKSLIQDIVHFSQDAILALGYRGEPAEHPDIIECITSAEEAGLSVYVETSGVGWRDVSALQQCRHTTFIVALDTVDKDTYTELRGDHFDEALAFIQGLRDAGLPVYVEATRLAGKEEICEEFYRYWKKHNDNIIIKKYNHYCGIVPQRKPVDLTPLERFPCWKSERELSILLDGTVALCEQDIHASIQLGNVFSLGIKKIWEAGETYHQLHIAENYPSLCKECDEYYVFNA